MSLGRFVGFTLLANFAQRAEQWGPSRISSFYPGLMMGLKLVRLFAEVYFGFEDLGIRGRSILSGGKETFFSS